jgi:ParB family chromosome partitioning protein
MSEIKLIPLKDIEVDYEFNCRGEQIIPSDVYELMENIKTNGLLSPVLVMPIEKSNSPNKNKYKYFLFAGFRRFAAFKYLKREAIPAVIHTEIELENAEQINLDENIQRRDLNILQEANGIYKFYSRGYTVDHIAKRFDKGRDWVYTRIQLLKLPRDVQAEAASGFLNARNIKEVFSLYEKYPNNPEKMYQVVRDIKDKKLRFDKKEVDKLNKKKNEEKVITKKQIRTFSEVFSIQDILIDLFYTNLTSRALAWSISEISTYELMEDILKECRLLDIPWSIPEIYKDEKFKNDKVKE